MIMLELGLLGVLDEYPECKAVYLFDLYEHCCPQ